MMLLGQSSTAHTAGRSLQGNEVVQADMQVVGSSKGRQGSHGTGSRQGSSGGRFTAE